MTEFPSLSFFTHLQESMNANPEGSSHLDPNEAYCGFAIDTDLYVFEFDGRGCAAVVPGGNELDLDFVVAGPRSGWRELLEAAREPDGDKGTLGDFVARGILELRSADEGELPTARDALPFLDVFLSHARDLDVSFD